MLLVTDCVLLVLGVVITTIKVYFGMYMFVVLTIIIIHESY
jgi:hypothetical protein